MRHGHHDVRERDAAALRLRVVLFSNHSVLRQKALVESVQTTAPVRDVACFLCVERGAYRGVCPPVVRHVDAHALFDTQHRFRNGPRL